MHHLFNSRLPIQDKIEKFVVLQLEVDHFSNKINENKYKNLIRSTKNNLNMDEEQIAQLAYLQWQFFIPCCLG